MIVNRDSRERRSLVRLVLAAALACCALLVIPVTANAATIYTKPVKVTKGFKFSISADKSFV